MKYGFLKVQNISMILLGKLDVRSGYRSLDMIYGVYRWFAHLYFFGIMQSIPFIVASKWECTGHIWSLSSLYILHCTQFVTGLLCNSSSMKKFMSFVLKYEKLIYPTETHYIRKTYDTYSNLNFYLIVFGIVCPTQFAFPYYFSQVSTTFAANQSDPCAARKGRIYHFWLPFDTERYFWIAMIFEIVQMVWFGNIHQFFTKLVPTTASTFQLAQIKVLQEMLKNVDEDAKELQRNQSISFDEAVNILINKCIKKLQEIVSLMDLLHEATRPIMLLEFFTNSMETASFVIQTVTATLTIGEGLGTVGVAAVLFLQIFIFFWQANEVSTESTRISDVIYNELNWIEYDQNAKRKLIIIMSKCQRPLSFQASGIGDMTVETFKKILKSCYSMVTFVKTVYND